MIISLRCALAAATLLAATPVLAQTAPADTAAPAASSAPAAEPAAPAAPATAPTAATPATPATPATGVIGAPPEGKGQVVFFRASAFTGMAVWFKVRENGVELGKLSNGVYFVQPADPGAHTYTAATENKDILKLEVDAGETYYVKGQLSMGIMMGEANLSPSDQATFEKAVKHMKPAKPAEAQASAATAK